MHEGLSPQIYIFDIFCYLRAFGQRFSVYVNEADSVKTYASLIIHSEGDDFFKFWSFICGEMKFETNYELKAFA